MGTTEDKKIRIAFIKFGGLSIGGSELWLQKIAVNLPRDKFEIDFYYCDSAHYTGSNYKHGDTDPQRVKYMLDNGINLIKFKVGEKDIRFPNHKWKDTDFWEKFDSKKYDLVQTVKAGPKEYPFYLIDIPVVEIVGLAVGVDYSKNIAWSFHSSGWQRREWIKLGGNPLKSSVLPAPVEVILTDENFRKELNIPDNAIVAGFHQRKDDTIASDIPLKAFSKLNNPNWHFIIKNGGDIYRKWAKEINLKNIHFLPADGDSKSISKFLNTLDIFAHGRKDGETFGAVLVEAMLHSKPCLSHWTNGGNNAQIETMGPGGLFAYNLNDYTEKLEKLFTDKGLREKLSRKAKEHADQNYSMKRCIDHLESIYRKVSGLNGNVIEEIIPYGLSDMGFLYAGDIDNPSEIAHHVLKGGIPEEFDIRIVESILPSIKNFIDIGANTGLYCFLASKLIKNGKVYAFEPQPKCIKTLRETIRLNNWEDKLISYEIGLGDKEEESELILSGTGSHLGGGFNDSVKKEKIKIKVDTLDNQIIKNNIGKVDFIKIDVEGFEYNTLKGSLETIRKDSPVLFIEIADEIKSNNYINTRYSNTLKLIKNLGYRIFISKNDKFKEIDINHKEKKAVYMYLCLHKDKHLKLLPTILETVKKYRGDNYILGVKKKYFIKVINKIRNPKYIIKKTIRRIFF